MSKVQQRLHYFKSNDCPLCRGAEREIEILKGEGCDISVHSIDEAEGLAEATYRGVLSTPTVVVEIDEREVGRYSGAISAEKILSKVGGRSGGIRP